MEIEINNEAQNITNSHLQANEIKESLVALNRTAKVVAGGRRFRFSAVVVAGDGKGRVGYGLGKAQEVTEARAKASQEARKNMIKVDMKEARTIHHDVKGHAGAADVFLRSARPGTGIIAGGAVRAIFENAGFHDIVSKANGSTNVHALIAATFDALKKLRTPKFIAEKRGKKISDIVS
jgi:small subunit ribosomal protein S5